MFCCCSRAPNTGELCLRLVNSLLLCLADVGKRASWMWDLGS